MGFSFVHAADLHLDTPFEGISRVSPRVAETLRDASLSAFDNLVDLAIDRDAAFVVVAGDVYDGADRGVRAQFRFRRGLERLSEKGIRSFVDHGNHDPVQEGWSAIDEWPEGVVVFGHESVDEVVVESQGKAVATVHGISFARREETENLALRFRRGDGPGIHVGVLHTNVGGIPDHDPYAPCSKSDLVRAGMDYWALGHIHQRQILQSGDPWIVYSGNLQGRSLKASEQGPKGAYVVEIDDATILEPEFVPLDVVRFEEREVPADNLTIAKLETELRQQSAELSETAEGRSLIVRYRVTGRGDIHADLARRGALGELLKDLRDEFGDRTPFVWCESVHDETAPERTIDIASTRERDDFAGALVAVADELRKSEDDFGEFVEGATLSLPTGPLARLGLNVEDQPDDELWSDSIMLALEMLAGDEP
jgi:exonuclease SbcD